MAVKEGKTSLLKKLVLAAAGLAVLFFLAALIAPMFIPWEKVRVEACKALTTQLKHEVSVEKVSFSIFSGVQLKNIKVGNGAGFSKEPLFSNQDAQVKYSLLGSLLARKAVITIKFIAPSILIEKNAQGVFNFSDMSPASKAAPAPEAKKASSGPVGELPVAINSLVISKANFVYKDAVKGVTAIKDLNFSLTGFSLSGGGDSRLKLDLVAQVQGKKIPMDLSMRFKLDLGKDAFLLKELTLKVPDAKISCAGTVESLQVSPKVDLKVEANLAGSPVGLELKVWDCPLAGLSGPLAAMKAKVSLKVTSPKLVLDPLLALTGADAEAKEPTEAELAAAEAAPEPAPLDLGKSIPAGLQVEESVEVGAIQMLKIVTGALKQSLKLSGQKAVVDLSLDAFRGALAAHVEANLAPPGAAYTLKAALKGLKAEDAVNAYADSFPKKTSLQQLRNKVFGMLSFEAAGSGKGLNGKAIKRNLNLTGHFKLADGKFSHLDMMAKAAGAIPYDPVKTALTSDLVFERTESNFTVAGGKASWKDFVSDSGKDGRGGNQIIESNGWMKLGAEVDYNVILRLNPKVNLGGMQQALSDDKGWATFDVNFTGATMAKSRPNYAAALKKAAAKVINQKVEEAKQKAMDEGKNKAQELIKDKGGDMLKGLFGK